MKVLVTGATGFVASHLVPALADEHEVVALGHDGARIAQTDGVEALELDLRRGAIEDHLPRVDAIVHLAQANVAFPEGASDLFAVNTASTFALVEYARKIKATHFVFASSASVYGMGDEPWREDDPLGASDFYSATKIAAEKLIAPYSNLLSTTVMRLVAPYGPGQRNRMIPRLIESVREGRPITLNQGGRPRMNPIYVGDVVQLVRRALAADGSRLINVAGDDVASIRELGELIGAAVGRDPVFEEGDGVAAGDIVCVNDRMRAVIEPGVVTPLRDGLGRTVEEPPAA